MAIECEDFASAGKELRLRVMSAPQEISHRASRGHLCGSEIYKGIEEGGSHLLVKDAYDLVSGEMTWLPLEDISNHWVKLAIKVEPAVGNLYPVTFYYALDGQDDWSPMTRYLSAKEDGYWGVAVFDGEAEIDLAETAAYSLRHVES